MAHHLQGIGDADWVKSRAIVIVFEECWPLAAELGRPDVVAVLDKVACSAKVKDAAGLGALAYALDKGKPNVLVGADEDRDVRIVSEGIRRPAEFWAWAEAAASEGAARSLVAAAYRAYRHGGWPWDRAFMQAAAYLAVSRGVPEVRRARTEAQDLPLWAALDKHTPQGKRALRDVAARARVPSRQLLWVSFYLESARTNESIPSNWWRRERQWRLGGVGLSDESAADLWSRLAPMVHEALEQDEVALQTHLARDESEQISLL